MSSRYESRRLNPARSARPALSVTVVVSREDDRFVAQCLEVDVSSFGDTQAEALAMVTEALELWFEDTPVPDHFSRPVVTMVDLHLSA